VVVYGVDQDPGVEGVTGPGAAAGDLIVGYPAVGEFTGSHASAGQVPHADTVRASDHHHGARMSKTLQDQRRGRLISCPWGDAAQCLELAVAKQ
jgi:hypothetical protein